jgi:hypothetical protein
MKSMNWLLLFRVNNVNVGCVTESWLNDDVQTEAIDIEGYICYRHDRSDGRKAGGVACYISVNWPCTRLKSLEAADFESIWLLLRKPVMPRQISHIVIGVIYHPPDAASGPMINHIITSIDSILQQHPYAGILLLGDFNSLNDKSLRDYPLKQVVNRPTRGRATLDKIFTNISDWFMEPIIIPSIASSDHCAVILLPTDDKPATMTNHRIKVEIQSNNRNGKNLLANALSNFRLETT